MDASIMKGIMPKSIFARTALCALVITTGPAVARVTEINVTAVEPFAEGELCDRNGTYSPFAATRAAREASNDPRRSLEERHGEHAAYVRKVEKAADQLVAQRLLLREDAVRLIAQAKSEGVAKRFAW